MGHRRVHQGFKPRKLILASPMSRQSLDCVLTWGLGQGALPGTPMPPVSGSGCRRRQCPSSGNDLDGGELLALSLERSTFCTVAGGRKGRTHARMQEGHR